jgi:allophanate hydrolase subunit 2
MKVNDMESQKDGQWVISGAVVEMNVDGAEVNVTQLYDVYSENGKIMKFYVYERANLPVE